MKIGKRIKLYNDIQTIDSNLMRIADEVFSKLGNMEIELFFKPINDLRFL